ncbi:hypothetical protein [Leifsonia xyli]|uniref:hypothetical protein n=1 Tax=Leifsonia xyli TaxID=1575 RepID=UPI001C401234|nr:hypothetical protein [Leifsonia xyli]
MLSNLLPLQPAMVIDARQLPRPGADDAEDDLVETRGPRPQSSAARVRVRDFVAAEPAATTEAPGNGISALIPFSCTRIPPGWIQGVNAR